MLSLCAGSRAADHVARRGRRAGGGLRRRSCSSPGRSGRARRGASGGTWDAAARRARSSCGWCSSRTCCCAASAAPGSEVLAAAVGLFGMALVPFVYWSVNFWRTIHPTTDRVPDAAAGDAQRPLLVHRCVLRPVCGAADAASAARDAAARRSTTRIWRWRTDDRRIDGRRPLLRGRCILRSSRVAGGTARRISATADSCRSSRANRAGDAAGDAARLHRLRASSGSCCSATCSCSGGGSARVERELADVSAKLRAGGRGLRGHARQPLHLHPGGPAGRRS